MTRCVTNQVRNRNGSDCTYSFSLVRNRNIKALLDWDWNYDNCQFTVFFYGENYRPKVLLKVGRAYHVFTLYSRDSLPENERREVESDASYLLRCTSHQSYARVENCGTTVVDISVKRDCFKDWRCENIEDTIKELNKDANY